MKLLFVIDNLGSGGAQRQLITIACGLKLKGHNVEVFTYYPADHFKHFLDEVSIPVHLFPKRGRFSIWPLIKLIRLINMSKYDIVISFLDTPNIYSIIACLFFRKVRLVVSERGYYLQNPSSIFNLLKGIFYLRANSIVANSFSQANWLKQRFPWLKSRVNTILNGVDLNLFKPCNNLSFFSNSEFLKLVAIGRVAEVKNLERLIESLSLLKNNGVKVMLDWVGRVDSDNYFKKCKKLLEDLEIEDQWRWVGERNDISNFILDYDALIIASISEGCPNVVCEAFACGLPVLGSDVSDIPYLVDPPRRGMVFNQLSSSSIAETILNFSNLDSAIRLEMRDKARRFSIESLSFDRLIDDYERELSNGLV